MSGSEIPALVLAPSVDAERRRRYAYVPMAEVDALIAHLGRRVRPLRAAVENADRLADAGERVGYASAYWTLRRAVGEFLAEEPPELRPLGVGSLNPNATFSDDPATRRAHNTAECPGCHPSGGETYRRGESIRQKADGSLTCLWCGRITAPAETDDVT
jgi:hypothetical protein